MVTCPHCGCHHAPVRHTTHYTIKMQGVETDVIRRFRTCQHCKAPFTTVEVPEDDGKVGYPTQKLYTPGPEVLEP